MEPGLVVITVNIPFGEECPAVVGMVFSCVFLSLLAPTAAYSGHVCMKIPMTAYKDQSPPPSGSFIIG